MTQLQSNDSDQPLEIIYHDKHMVVVNKPCGLLVHRSKIDRYETRFAVQILRDQLGQRVYPIHRLDKPTSGLLVFGLDAESARQISLQFQNRQVQKSYLALVRGWPQSQLIDRPLAEVLDSTTDSKVTTNKEKQQALTQIRLLKRYELPLEVDKYPSSRYSLIEINLQTGRRHQIRRHLKSIHHPLIGDTTYGKTKHNSCFAKFLQSSSLLLTCTQITLHSVTKSELIKLGCSTHFEDVLEKLEEYLVEPATKA